MNSPHFRSTTIFLSLAAVFLFLQLFRLPAVPILFEGDHAVHMANAWRMFLGENAFRDFFLITFPGTEIYYLSLFKFFGVHQWLLNATIFFLLLALSALGLYFSRHVLTGWAVYLPISIFLVVGFRSLGVDGSHRFFSVLAVFIAAWIIFSRRTVSRLCLAGFFCGISSSFTQPRGLVGFAAICCFLLVEKIYAKQSFADFIKLILCAAIPFGLTVGFIFAYFIAAAGFENFYYAAFVFPVKNYTADNWNNFNAYLKEVPNLGTKSLYIYLKQAAPIIFFYVLIPSIYLIFFVVLRLKRPLLAVEKKLQLIFINLVGLFLALGIASAPSATRLYQVSIPGLISLVWILQLYVKQSRIYLGLLLIFGLLGISYIVQRQTATVYPLAAPSGSVVSLSPENLSRYRWTAEHTQPLDYFYEPHHPSLYTLFQLRNPTPMGLIRANDYTTDEQVKSVISGLEKNPPRFIIWNSLWSEERLANAPDFHLQPLADFLKANYHPVEKLNNYGDNKDETEYQVEVWERNQAR